MEKDEVLPLALASGCHLEQRDRISGILQETAEDRLDLGIVEVGVQLQG